MHSRNEFQTASPLRATAPAKPDLSGPFIAERYSRKWHEAAALVEEQYARWFNALPHPDYPSFLGIQDTDGRPSAVIGARQAARHSTFCEFYIDQDIAALISDRAQTPVARSGIAELGNLAVASRKQLIPLIMHVHQWAIAQSCDWIVFCLTRELRASFTRMAIEMLPLTPARPERVVSNHQQWGSYYLHDPYVLAARVHQTPDFSRGKA